MEISPELAEFTGIVAGDGNLFKTKQSQFRIIITGHSEDDYDYHTTYIIPLLEKLNAHAKLWKYPDKNAIRTTIYSKCLFNFLLENGFINGPKTNLRVPKYFLNNTTRAGHFLRGLIDTDFSICFKKGTRKSNSYPVISGTFSNELFTKDVKTLFELFGIKTNLCYRITNRYGKLFDQYQLDIYGASNLEKVLQHIGFSNPKHKSKIELWKNQGFCSPHSTYRERLAMLKK